MELNAYIEGKIREGELLQDQYRGEGKHLKSHFWKGFTDAFKTLKKEPKTYKHEESAHKYVRKWQSTADNIINDKRTPRHTVSYWEGHKFALDQFKSELKTKHKLAFA